MSEEHHQKNTCPSNTENSEDNEQASFLHFDLLTINDRKTSLNETEMQINGRQIDCCGSPSFKNIQQQPVLEKKNKLIRKKQKKDEDDKKISMNRKQKITFLENKVKELEKEISSLRRSQHYCRICRNQLPIYYRERIEELIQPEQATLNGAGDYQTKRYSKDSIQFEKIDFHTPLMQTREMQEKMWIFVGTMLIAMGSKVMDFDGTINIFKVLKQSVDKIRRQVQKCQPKLGLQFYCLKQQLREPTSMIDGMNFDPFYSGKQELRVWQLQFIRSKIGER